MGLSPLTIPTQPPELEFLDGKYPLASPVAYECLLQFYLQDRSATYLNGLLNETLLSTFIDNTQTGGGFSWTSPPTNGSLIQNYTVTSTSLQALTGFLKTFFAGNASLIGPFGTLPATPQYSSPQMQPVVNAMNHSINGFPEVMDNMAASLSQALRQLPYLPSAASGNASSTYVYVEVRWAWLSFPITLSLAGLILLVLVVLETHKSRLSPWRNNVLAVLFHGFDSSPQHTNKLERENNMKTFARTLLVELKEHGDGDRLVTAAKQHAEAI